MIIETSNHMHVTETQVCRIASTFRDIYINFVKNSPRVDGRSRRMLTSLNNK